MKYSEAKNQIYELSSLYNIDMDDGDFNVRCELVMDDFTFVEGCEQYQIYFYSGDALSKIPSKDKLYMILVKLAMTLVVSSQVVLKSCKVYPWTVS